MKLLNVVVFSPWTVIVLSFLLSFLVEPCLSSGVQQNDAKLKRVKAKRKNRNNLRRAQKSTLQNVLYDDVPRALEELLTDEPPVDVQENSLISDASPACVSVEDELENSCCGDGVGKAHSTNSHHDTYDRSTHKTHQNIPCPQKYNPHNHFFSIIFDPYQQGLFDKLKEFLAYNSFKTGEKRKSTLSPDFMARHFIPNVVFMNADRIISRIDYIPPFLIGPAQFIRDIHLIYDLNSFWDGNLHHHHVHLLDMIQSPGIKSLLLAIMSSDPQPGLHSDLIQHVLNAGYNSNSQTNDAHWIKHYLGNVKPSWKDLNFEKPTLHASGDLTGAFQVALESGDWELIRVFPKHLPASKLFLVFRRFDYENLSFDHLDMLDRLSRSLPLQVKLSFLRALPRVIGQNVFELDFVSAHSEMESVKIIIDIILQDGGKIRTLPGQLKLKCILSNPHHMLALRRGLRLCVADSDSIYNHLVVDCDKHSIQELDDVGDLILALMI